MSEEYTVVGKFLSPSNNPGETVKMVIIQDQRGVCVMPESEWKWMQDKFSKHMRNVA